jgi:hypothetical protein
LRGLPLEFTRNHVLALECPLDLPDVERIHVREPIEIRRVEWCDAHCAGGPRDPLRQTCGDREAMRASDRGAGKARMSAGLSTSASAFPSAAQTAVLRHTLWNRT